jgi:hypothetical protein
MMFATLDAIPLIITLNRLSLDEAVAVAITVVVPIDPPTFEVSILPDTD